MVTAGCIHAETVAASCNLQPGYRRLLWSELTALPEKTELFKDDCFFREAVHQTLQAGSVDIGDFIRNHTLLLFKPDAVVARKVRPTLQHVCALGYRPVWFQTLALTRRSMRELWRYSWNSAAVERIALSTVLNEATTTLCVVLRRAVPVIDVPAAVQLAYAKGSAAPDKRKPDHLRSLLGAPNRILSFFHCADEPADFLRELAVLFDTGRRAQLLRSVSSYAGEIELAPTIERLEAEHDFHDLDLRRCTDEVWASGSETGRLFRQLLQATGRRSRAGEVLQDRGATFIAATELLQRQQDPASFWNALCALSEIVPGDPPGARSLIPNDSFLAWRISARCHSAKIPNSGTSSNTLPPLIPLQED
jgi:hypothetical protein